jgi:hypothetical protein
MRESSVLGREEPLLDEAMVAVRISKHAQAHCQAKESSRFPKLQATKKTSKSEVVPKS